MRYLITGATGLVGSEILRLCKERKIVVHYFTTQKSKIKNNSLIKGFYWNPLKGKIDLSAFKGITHIIHLAGATVAKRWTPSYKKQILNSRTQSANLLFDTLKRIPHSVKHFLSASATGIYPNSLTDFYKEENKDRGGDFLSKVVEAWEDSANQFKKLGLKVSKIRIGLVLSNKGGALPKMTTPIKYFLGAAFGKGGQWQSWIHINDLARLFLYVTKNELKGTYNGTAPNPITQNKLIKSCADVLGKPLYLPNIPEFVSKLIFGEMSMLLLSSQRVCNRKIINEGFNFGYNTIESAVENILEAKTYEVIKAKV